MLAATAPTVVRPGREFELKIALAGELRYPVRAAGQRVRVRNEQAGPAEFEAEFAEGVAAMTAGGIVIEREGLSRFEVEWGGKVWHSNPVCCRKGGPEVFWGDPHVHSVLSNCHPDKCRSLLFAFLAGRHFSHLDWMAVADHVSNGRCELARWKDQAATADAFDDPPAFVTLPAYEASFQGGAGGDNNVYMTRFPAMFVEDHDNGNVRTMVERLSESMKPGEEFIVVPHHTTRAGKHGEIAEANYPGPAVMPVVEVHSKWGTSEYRGNPNPLHEIHPGPSYAVDFLDAGLPLGFVGGTDTHSTMPAGYGREHLDRLPGMTAVMAETLTRAGVYEAIRGRDCYAASGERIFLKVEVAGAAMGKIVPWSDERTPRLISGIAAAQSDIETIEIVRNGITVHQQEIKTWRGIVTFADVCSLEETWLESRHLGRFVYYYVRVTCASGAQAWSSPVWLIGK